MEFTKRAEVVPQRYAHGDERAASVVRDRMSEGDPDVFEDDDLLAEDREEEEREETYFFLKELGIPVVADVTSGLREALGNQVISEKVLRGNLPGRILR